MQGHLTEHLSCILSPRIQSDIHDTEECAEEERRGGEDGVRTDGLCIVGVKDIVNSESFTPLPMDIICEKLCPYNLQIFNMTHQITI